MPKDKSELNVAQKRKIENEVVFRKANERAQKSLKQVQDDAKTNSDDSLAFNDNDIKLHFYCECADENCKSRIVMIPKKYQQLHSNKKAFIVLPGHEVSEIEKVLKKQSSYNLIEKYTVPPFDHPSLNVTDVQNA